MKHMGNIFLEFTFVKSSIDENPQNSVLVDVSPFVFFASAISQFYSN
jgi:hypothetical protein